MLANVPPWASLRAIQLAFNVNGPVEKVILQRVPSAGEPPNQTKTLIKEAPGLLIHAFVYLHYLLFHFQTFAWALASNTPTLCLSVRPLLETP